MGRTHPICSFSSVRRTKPARPPGSLSEPPPTGVVGGSSAWSGAPGIGGDTLLAKESLRSMYALETSVEGVPPRRHLPGGRSPAPSPQPRSRSSPTTSRGQLPRSGLHRGRNQRRSQFRYDPEPGSTCSTSPPSPCRPARGCFGRRCKFGRPGHATAVFNLHTGPSDVSVNARPTTGLSSPLRERQGAGRGAADNGYPLPIIIPSAVTSMCAV